MVGYILCTSPRSGSTLLCGLLAATGRAGDPDSHFHQPSLAAWLADYDLRRDDFADEDAALSAVFAAALARGRGGTDVFGMRLQQHSFEFFNTQLARLYPGRDSDVARLRAAFGDTVFIHLTRDDKLAQAISFIKASQTGLWHRARDGSELERLSSPKPPVYDAGLIAAQIAEFEAAEVQWLRWFATEGITPLRLRYEDLAADPGGVLAQVLAALSLPAILADGVVPGVARLADATSRDWAARFRRDAGPR